MTIVRCIILLCLMFFGLELASNQQKDFKRKRDLIGDDDAQKQKSYTTGTSRKVIENFIVKMEGNEKVLKKGMILKVANKIEEKTESRKMLYRVIRILEGENADFYEISQDDLDNYTECYTDYASQCPICLEDCPIMLLTKCKHKFCVQCLYKHQGNTPEEQLYQTCPFCRTEIGDALFFECQFINIYVQFPEIFEREMLQFLFPFIFMVPETTKSVIQKWMAIDTEKINVNAIAEIDGGMTPLMVGILAENLELVKFLLNQGANQYYVNKNGIGMIHMAAMTTKLEIVQFFLDRKFDINQQSNMGTPLMASTVNSTPEMMEFLINNGAEVNAKTKNDDLTPLFAAIFKNDSEKIKLLLKYNADPTLKSCQTTASSIFMALAYNNSLENINQLLDNGAEIDYFNDESFTSLHYAIVQSKSFEIIETFVNHNANVNLGEKIYNCTPLIAALKLQRMDVVELLLTKNPIVDTKTSAGYTVLHAAASIGSIDLFKDLCKRGALVHINSISNDGGTPLDQAVMHQKVDLVKYLVDEMKAEKTLGSDTYMKNNWEIFKFLKSKELFREYDPIIIIKLLQQRGLDPNSRVINVIETEKDIENLMEELKYEREFHKYFETLKLFEKLIKEKMENENERNKNE